MKEDSSWIKDGCTQDEILAKQLDSDEMKGEETNRLEADC